MKKLERLPALLTVEDGVLLLLGEVRGLREDLRELLEPPVEKAERVGREEQKNAKLLAGLRVQQAIAICKAA